MGIILPKTLSRIEIIKLSLNIIDNSELISKKWFRNFKNPSSFQLTSEGFLIMKKKWKTFPIKVNNKEFTAKLLIDLDNNIKTPWYIKLPTLHFFHPDEDYLFLAKMTEDLYSATGCRKPK